jgi:tripartite-type tricarboxylate transporter receptor subunit TctC
MNRFPIWLVLLASLIAAFPAAAADWPLRPVKILVGAPPGGMTDILARMMQEPLGQALGQPFVVENKPGGGGIAAVETLVRERNDHQILIVVSSLSSAPAMKIATAYDAVRDVAPVVLLGRIPLLIAANPAANIASMDDLIRLAKQRPGALTYGTPGVGLAQHFSGELLKYRAGIDIVHVPYRGASPAINDLVGNQIPLAIVSPASVKSFVDAGRVRAVALTGPARLPLMPGVATVAEAALPGFEISEWYGVAMAGGTGQAIVERLNAEIRKVFETAERKTWRDSVALEGGLGSAEDFKGFIVAEIKKLSEIAANANIKPE